MIRLYLLVWYVHVLFLQIANIRVKLNELKEILDETVRSQDFSRAAEVKQSISELEAERNQLLDLPQTQTEEIRTEKVSFVEA